MPTGSNLVILVVGLAFIVVGGLMIAKEGFARFTLRVGGARIWNALLGEARALKLTRFFFAPLVIVVGLLLVLGSFVAAPTKLNI